MAFSNNMVSHSVS